jgi:hypothetical protein
MREDQQMPDEWRSISIVSNLKSRELEAWLGGAHLSSAKPVEPGSADEVAVFCTSTLIRLFEVMGAMSAHERMSLLSQAAASTTEPDGCQRHNILGPFQA